LNERLSIGFRLLKKHQFQSTAELLSLQHQIEEKLDGYKRMISTIAELENKMKQAYEKCLSLAQIISKNRISVIDIFTNEINALLMKVGMPNAKLKVRMEDSPLTKDGIDNLDFLFDANNKNKFESLGKVASGGELSRLMLCIKSLVAQKLAMPTMIFDEIDSGISGEAAKQVAGIMRSLSQNHQIITITHQPQIAAKADAHYYVYKNKKQLGVQTEIRLLAFEERVMEIAKMLSGDKPTTTALEIAKEMIHN
jgi:DNA repair protein RecN (Recombination protein N)